MTVMPLPCWPAVRYRFFMSSSRFDTYELDERLLARAADTHQQRVSCHNNRLRLISIVSVSCRVKFAEYMATVIFLLGLAGRCWGGDGVGGEC